MDFIKAMGLGAVLAWVVAVVVGSQGASGGALAVHTLILAETKIYWSWPVFLAGSGLAWGLMLLQR